LRARAVSSRKWSPQMKYVAGGDVLDAVVAAVDERAVAVEWLSANAATVLAAVPRYRLPASGTSLARAAAAIAGRGCGCASSPLAPGTTSYSRIGFAHEYRPLNATWALTYGALRTYWALGHGPRFPTAPADIPSSRAGARRTVCSDLVDPLGPVDPLGKHRVTRHTHSVASGVDRARGRIHGEPGLVHPHRPRALGFRPTSAPPTESCNGSWPATNSPLPSSSSPAAASQTYSGDDACSSLA